MRFLIKTAAFECQIEAADADEAADRFATAYGFDAWDLESLIDAVKSIPGNYLVVHEEGVLVALAAVAEGDAVEPL
jgi:hypothetical protein